MSSIDNAISRLQAIALSSTDLTIKNAPDKPVSSATALPLVIAHLSSGEGDAIADWVEERVNISVDFHFSATSLKQAYTLIDACAPEFMQRLAGDPNLNNTVDTIIFPVTFEVIPTQWDSVQTQMLSFTVPVKLKETKVTT